MQTLPITELGLSRSARAEAEAREITARHLNLAGRASLGFIFAVVGANSFFHFLPSTPDGGLWGFASALQLVVGVLLLANRYTTVAVAASTPLALQLFAAYAAGHGRMSLPLVAVAFSLYLLWTNRDAFRVTRLVQSM